MTNPTVAVYAGFGSTWKTAEVDIVWTDISAYVGDRRELVTVFRGATSAHGTPGAGTIRLTLIDKDRRFDPLNTAGPYYGDLLPGVPIKVAGLTGIDPILDGSGDPILDGSGDPLLSLGAAVPIARGFIGGWPQHSHRGDTVVTVPISAIDGFQNLARAGVPKSVLSKTMLSLAPQNYYRLAEPPSAGRVADETGNDHGTVVDEPAFGEQPLRPGLLPSAAFADDGDRIDLSRSPLVQDEYHMSIVAMMRTSTPATAGKIRPLFAQSDGNGPGKNDALTFYVNDAGVLCIDYYTVGLGFSFSGGTVTDGQSHLVIAQSNVGYGTDYGVAVDSATLQTTPNTAAYRSGNGAAIAGTPNAARGFEDQQFVGRLSDVGVFTRPLSAAERQQLVDALDAWSGDRTDERLGRILDHIGWPSDLRNMSAGKSTLGPASFEDSDSALSYLRLIEATEGGRLFVDPSGRLAFHDRHHPFTADEASTSQVTFTDEPGGIGFADFDWDLDDELVVNSPRYSRRGGAEIREDDVASQELHGIRDEVLSDLLLETDNEVRGRAQWTVATRSQALARVRSITVPLHAYDASEHDQVLGLDLGHRVSVQRTPMGVGDPITRDFTVDGIRHRIGVAEWWVELYVSPAPDQALDLFTLGTSTLGGTHVLAF